MISNHRSNRRSALTVVLFLAFPLFMIGLGRYGLHTRSEASLTGVREVLSVPPGAVLRQMDLGYHTLFADLLFLRANIYYGYHITTDEDIPWMQSFIDILLDLDPDFKSIYLWGALVTIFYKRHIDIVPKTLIDRANNILEKGMRRFPDDYRFPMRIGYNLYYELGEVDRSIPYFERAASLENAPAWIDGKLVDLYKKKNQKELAVKILKEFMMEGDDIMNESLRARMLHIMTKEERDKMFIFRKQLEESWKSCCNYISFDTFLLVKEP